IGAALRELFIGTYALAALGAYLCARMFGARPAAALVAAFAYAFSGTLFNTGVARMQSNLTGAAWLPVHLGLVRWTVVSGQPAAALALGIAGTLSILGGHPQYVLMSVYLCAAY